ncbi:hypothetical protein DPMN_108720 [Dreissena polymorpha]|uniref:Uncharacterized protein n=1 Tax=Dreissena polymorpha TaxID=45954 RepID=A0A9D4K9E4_DREPO|nr:hypothetical protein DPMN_108720 [Dreissena polymorpha]
MTVPRVYEENISRKLAEQLTLGLRLHVLLSFLFLFPTSVLLGGVSCVVFFPAFPVFRSGAESTQGLLGEVLQVPEVIPLILHVLNLGCDVWQDLPQLPYLLLCLVHRVVKVRGLPFLLGCLQDLVEIGHSILNDSDGCTVTLGGLGEVLVEAVGQTQLVIRLSKEPVVGLQELLLDLQAPV